MLNSDGLKLFIFDLDGTLFRGEEPTPGAVETVTELRQRGAHIRFFTNNSSKTRSEQAAKLGHLGFNPAIAEIYTAAEGAARYCQEAELHKIFLVGEASLHATFAGAGLKLVKDSADAVVMGICRSFTYALLNEALQCLQRGSRFIATNPDPTYPLENGRIEPGAGSLIAALSTCSGQSPFVVGKPNPYLVNQILADANCPEDQALMVGDRMDTDIAAGIAAGCPTHLVLCGVTAEAPSGQPFSPDLRGLLDEAY